MYNSYCDFNSNCGPTKTCSDSRTLQYSTCIHTYIHKPESRILLYISHSSKYWQCSAVLQHLDSAGCNPGGPPFDHGKHSSILCVSMNVCVCQYERMCVCQYDKKCVNVCQYECMCVCVSIMSMNVCANMCACAYVRVFVCVFAYCVYMYTRRMSVCVCVCVWTEVLTV